MFNSKHAFQRASIKIFLLFLLVESVAIYLFLHSPKKVNSSEYVDALGQTRDLSQFAISEIALWLFIPIFFVIYSLMGRKITRERTENANKQMQRDFPFLNKNKELPAAELTPWITRNATD